MSVNFDPVDSNVPTVNSLVQSSSPTVASKSTSSSPCSSSSKLTSVCSKLIAFPSNVSATSSSLSVNGSYYNKKHHQPNDQRNYYLDNDNCKISSSSSSSPPSSSSSVSDSLVSGTRKSMVNSYTTIDDHTDTRLNQEWCSDRKKQLDDILIRLQQLRKVNLDDRENIEGMKKKTIKLIATYSSITIKTNNFLTSWERKYGFKLKAIQSTKVSSSSSSLSSSSSSSSSSPFSHNHDEMNYYY